MKTLRPQLRGALLAALASAASSGGLHAGTIVWNNTSTDWATGANWTGGNAPANDLTTDIASFGSTTQVPTWGAARSVNGLSFTAAATYTIGSNAANFNLNVGSSGLNFGNNAVTLNINDSSFNQNLRLGGTTAGQDSGVTTGTGAVTIRATTTASQYLLTIENGRTATFNIGSGGLTVGGNSGTGSTRQAIAFGNSTSTLLKTGSGTLSFLSGSTNGAPGLANGIYDIRQGTLSSDVNNGNFFGTSPITLGDTTGSAAATLQIQRVGTFNNALTVRSGSSGVKTFAVTNQSQTTSGTITLNDNLTFQLRANGGAATNVTQSGAISGAGNLAFNTSNNTAGVATGNLTLGVANPSWTGALTIGNAASDTSKVANLVIGNTAALSASNNVTVNSQGTLRLNGNNLTIGSLSGSGTSSFVENANATPSTLTVSSTSPTDTNYTGVLQNGTGGGVLNFVKSGTGIQRLSQANTFTGSVSVTGGQLYIQHTSGLSASNDVDVGASGIFSPNVGNNNTLNIGKLSGSGTVTGSLGGNANSVLAINVASGNSTFSGSIGQQFSGTFGLTKLGGGTQILGGASTYTGPTLVSQGTLLVNNTTGSGTGNGTVTVSSGATLGGSGSISGNTTVNGGTLGSSGNTLTLGNTLTTTGASTLASGATVNVTGATNVSSGTFTVSGTLGGSGIVNVASGATLAGTASLGATTVAGGTLGSNGNTLTLGSTLGVTGDNSIVSGATVNVAGTTTVSSGVFTVNGTLGGAGNKIIGATATLGGTGTVSGGATTLSGTVAPGNSPGTLTLGATSFEAAANYNWQVVDATGIAGTGFDTINLLTGTTLTINATSGSTFNINLWSLSSTGPDVNGLANNFINTNSYSWTLVATDTSIVGFAADKFTVNTGAINGTNGFTNALTGTFGVVLADSGTDLVLTYTPIPEPSAAAALAGLGAVGLAFFRRRHTGR